MVTLPRAISGIALSCANGVIMCPWLETLHKLQGNLYTRNIQSNRYVPNRYESVAIVKYSQFLSLANKIEDPNILSTCT